MSIRLFILLILFSFGCSSSQFDCPKPESVRLKRKAGVNYRVLLARHRQQPKKISRSELKQLMSRETKTVTVEEWDCPKPGAKKYMPKTVKDNIKRNFKKINSTNVSSDSVNTIH